MEICKVVEKSTGRRPVGTLRDKVMALWREGKRVEAIRLLRLTETRWTLAQAMNCVQDWSEEDIRHAGRSGKKGRA